MYFFDKSFKILFIQGIFLRLILFFVAIFGEKKKIKILSKRFMVLRLHSVPINRLIKRLMLNKHHSTVI